MMIQRCCLRIFLCGGGIPALISLIDLVDGMMKVKYFHHGITKINVVHHTVNLFKSSAKLINIDINTYYYHIYIIENSQDRESFGLCTYLFDGDGEIK